MSAALQLLKLIGGPGSLGFLAVAVVLGLLLLRRPGRSRSLGKVWLTAVGVSYLVLASPWAAHGLIAILPSPPVSTSTPPAGPAVIDTLIVFAGDNGSGRILAARSAFQTFAPREVWLLGDRFLFEELAGAGIPKARLHLDESAWNTQTQMVSVRRMLTRRGQSRVPGRSAIVASRLQMPRIARLAEKRGLTALVLLPSPVDHEPPRSGPWLVLPTYGTLLVSRDALYELVAIGYYRWRGWI